MKHLLLLLIAMTCLLSMCKSSLKVDHSINEINISVEQDGKLIRPNKGVLALEKKEFNLIIDLPKPMAVLTNTSFDDELYRLASKEKQLATRSEFKKEHMLAVSLFNAEQTLYLSDESSSPYFYENDEEHNFSSVEIIDGHYKCTRRIKYFQEKELDKRKLDNIDKPIFLVFTPEYILDSDPDKIRFQGKYLKVEWIETQNSDNAKNEDTLVGNTKLDTETLDSATQDSSLLANVIKQLDLDESEIPNELLVMQVMPNNPNETIIVIPEIAYEVEYDFEYNSHIIIVNNKTGKITHTYFQSSAWASDAIVLSDISIDTFPFYLSENKQAFGIKVHYHTRSQPNPYSNSTLSLFVKSNNTLKEVLNSFDVIDYSAEWDMHCAGESIGHKKTLSMVTNKTNGYNDISVKNKITETKSYEAENGDCESKDIITSEETLLKFNGVEYKEVEVLEPMNVYLNDFDKDGIFIRQELNGKIILDFEKLDDYFTLTITKAKEGWFKVINVEGIENGIIEISGGEGWIHGSDLEVSTRKKIELLDAPENGVVLGSIDLEVGVQLKGKIRNWIQVEYEGLTGWVESQWLCGNPVTTCP